MGKTLRKQKSVGFVYLWIYLSIVFLFLTPTKCMEIELVGRFGHFARLHNVKVSKVALEREAIVFKDINKEEKPAITYITPSDRSKHGRIIIDFKNTLVVRNLIQAKWSESSMIDRMDISQYDIKTTRISIDPKRPVSYSFSVDTLFLKNKAAFMSNGDSFRLIKADRIVIDPGHGGKDPGAIGPTGVLEKDVTLGIATKIEQLMKGLGKQVLLTRKSDVFVPLEERARMANAFEADVFLSIHTNASLDKKKRGFEIYVPGDATDNISKELAIRENAGKLPKETEVYYIVNDIRLEARNLMSYKLANVLKTCLVNGIRSKFSSVCNLGVKKAPFIVLMEANMPCVLLEVGFITNKQEEKIIASKTFAKILSGLLVEGLPKYENTEELFIRFASS